MHTRPTPKRDILFVVDNSASMYAIQTNMDKDSLRFFNRIKDYNYHIGITTQIIS